MKTMTNNLFYLINKIKFNVFLFNFNGDVFHFNFDLLIFLLKIDLSKFRVC